MKNSAPNHKESRPCFIASSRRVTRVSAGFTELTGYLRKEVINADIDAILSLLRLTERSRAECWLFTKTLEPREVIVSRHTESSAADGSGADGSGADGTEEIYTFCEKPHSRLEEALPYPCQLLEENVTGVAICSAENMTLLKANQTYLDLCGEPFRKPDKAIGRTIGALIGGYKGSPAEEAVNRSMTTGKSEAVKEFRFDHFKRGVTYWDQLITPVKADGRIKYVVINTQDVTARVTHRQQYEWLAAVYENMPFPLVALDRDGKGTNANRAARELFSPPCAAEPLPGSAAQGGMLTGTQFYDADDNPIDPNDTPCHKVRWGERAADFMMAVKKGKDTSYVNVSGTPIYDIDGEFVAGLISYRDVTEQARYAKHHKSLIDAMQSGVVQYDSEGRVITMNPAAVKILGKMPEKTVGRPITEQLPTIKSDGSEFASEEYPVTLALRTGKPVQYTKMGFFNSVTEEYRWININAVPLFHPSDTAPYQAFAVFDDITEQKKAEDMLKKSEAALRSVLDNSGDFIYSLNTQTNTYEYVSPSAVKVLGCSAETFMATDVKTFYESVHPDDRPVFEAALRALDEKNETEIRFRQRVNDGEYRWFSNHLTDVRDENGLILYRNGRIRDITEQVESDEVIRYQAGLLQSISDIIIASDENNNITTWNKAAELTYGWTEEEAVGQRIDTLLKTQVIGTSFEEVFSSLLQYGKVEMETIDTCKDGRKLSIICSPHIIQDANGKMTGIVGIFRDITEKKKMEDALREKETHLRMAAEAAKLGTYAFNLINGTIFLSEELKALWGVLPGAPVELDNMFFFKGLHPDDKQPFLDKISAANAPNGDGLIKHDYRVILPDGAVKWLHMRGQTSFGDMGGKRVPVYATGVAIDITERVAAEQSLQEMSEELQNIVDSTDDYIASFDREYRLILFNTAFESFVKSRLGCQLEKGARLSDILPPEFAPFWTQLLERAAGEGKYQIELSIDEGARIMSYSFNPLYDDGKLTEITVFGKDITGRLNSEREIIRLNTTLEKRVQERTEELQKSISDLKNLSRIISHDLKEPIRQIGHDAGHIQELTEKGPIRSKASDIKKTCGRMTRLIDSLSEFAMSSELKIKKETVNVKKMVIAIYNELKAAAANNTRLQFESGLPDVCADSLLLRRVLYNLLSNAMKFSSKRDISEITVGCAEVNGQYEFSIRDNGVGFDMQYAHKLFNAFERLHTEEEFAGSGMGLAAVRNIIERHGGRTWIESREDVGTTVYFTLPA